MADEGQEIRMPRGIGVADFKNELRRLKQDAINDLARKMDELVDKADFSSQAQNDPFMATLYLTSESKRHRHANKDGKEEPLPEKEFVMRNSVLTDLFKSRHIQTCENIAIAALLLWVIGTGVSDFFETQSFRGVLPSSELVERAFDNFHIGLLFWVKMQIIVIVFYPITLFWAKNRHHPNLLSTKNFDRFFMVGYCTYQAYMLILPAGVLFRDRSLGPATATAIATEQIRFMMKMHSFGREVWKKVRKGSLCENKKSDDDQSSPSTQNVNFPGFSQYLYFLFAPTLIYRDAYPRTESIDWHYVFSNSAQVAGVALFLYYVMVRYLQPEFAVYSPNEATLETVLKRAFNCTLPGSIILMFGFFAFQHSWLNAWAEMLRFGDRLFYKDWWNASSFAEYYRTWNCVVHDWLYTYIYKDTQDIKCNKFVSAFLVFAASATCHEYIIIAMMKFFFPFLLLQLCGPAFFVAMVRSRGRLSSIVLWASFAFGLGLVVSMYAFEISARSTCPPAYNDFFLDTVVPRFITCRKQ